MTLNCKVGDLAIVVRGPTSAKIPNGTIVQCKRFLPQARDVWTKTTVSNVWEVDFRSDIGHPEAEAWGIEDARLVPLRDPGDHEVDRRDVLLGQRAAA